ncbi:zinc finger matrin-type protein 5-like [Sycon ciliatum]|uniref:zinc finger matrin-type protein 5-like n=1 Tax=Sycon ciliatum TaxID=27933 RepID=UPI0031F67FC7
MGKRYHCDFCNKSFQDSRAGRLRHFRGTQHQRLRQQHYDSFKDPAELAASSREQPMCIQFARNGHCPYGTACKYSHRSAESVTLALPSYCCQSSVEAVNLAKDAQADCDRWLESWKQRQRDRRSERKSRVAKSSPSQQPPLSAPSPPPPTAPPAQQHLSILHSFCQSANQALPISLLPGVSQQQLAQHLSPTHGWG